MNGGKFLYYSFLAIALGVLILIGTSIVSGIGNISFRPTPIVCGCGGFFLVGGLFFLIFNMKNGGDLF